MEDYLVFVDMTCVRVGVLHSFYDKEFDVHLSYRDCDFKKGKSHVYGVLVPDFRKIEVGKTYTIIFQTLEINGERETFVDFMSK